jgi:hypothetical protein
MKRFSFPAIALMMVSAITTLPAAATDLRMLPATGWAAPQASGQHAALSRTEAVIPTFDRVWPSQEQGLRLMSESHGRCFVYAAFLADCQNTATLPEAGIFYTDARDTSDLLGIPRPKAAY